MARTARQRAALRKAQIASARKRKGHGSSRKRKIAKGAAAVAAVGAVAYGTHHGAKKYRRHKTNKVKNEARARISKRRPQTGLKLHKSYRMGRPDVRRRRKRAKHG